MKNGFSILQFIFVLGILLIVLFFTIPNFKQFYQETKSAKLHSDFELVYKAVLNGVTDWEIHGGNFTSLDIEKYYKGI